MLISSNKKMPNGFPIVSGVASITRKTIKYFRTKVHRESNPLKGKNLRNVLGEFQIIMTLELVKYFEAKLENRFLMTLEYLPKKWQRDFQSLRLFDSVYYEDQTFYP